MTTQQPPRLEMRRVVKTFGPVVALDSVDLVVARNEVHGLLGGNGAGKTTLMNVLYGLYRPNSGEVLLDGEPVTVGSPRDAIDAGVGMVHQTFLQVDNYTVTENIVLGTDVSGALRLDLDEARKRIRELSTRFGLSVDPDAVVEDLPVGVRQRVEILKALYRGARLLILDEPTTNLTPQEVDDLFGSMRAMVDDGMSVVLITHKIRETLGVCDRMTVMRDGRSVETIERSDTDADHLADVMVGGTTGPGELIDAAALGAVDAEEVEVTVSSVRDAVGVSVQGLVVNNDQGHELVPGFDLEIREGEIVGIAGVAGNGQVELAEALAGVRAVRAGSVEVGGRSMCGRPASAWLDHGVAYVPEDRHRDGILPTASITENLVLGSQRSPGVRRHGLLDWGAAKQRAVEAIEQFSIRANGPATPAGDLSGGNIQRVILARAFARRPRMLILHNPTRGLDLGSTRFVYDQVRVATDAGCAILLLSEDLDEVIAMSDRVIALFKGSRAGEWQKGTVDAYEVGRSMTGLGEARV
ncbi:ABC transporter ATP-binding protein [Nocardioides sp. YIM 152315]|uniref:ABC transporter ATP-binding protein n=1 Tax=Nocardioides sp. YIM 152315 TaxID=3031760 RepID=UPI0023DBA644|nr:ABC transporter ATP-binding protein [Nocardioides sp. YIM 152315]MDF1602278.1 ABC transporter ATP-binding protein [Nocardioides sp. YIM 152315]